MQLSRGKLVASFAAVILGGVLLAVLGVAFTSSNNPPTAPATPHRLLPRRLSHAAYSRTCYSREANAA